MFSSSSRLADPSPNTYYAGTPTGGNLTSPLAAALYVENRKLIKEAARILCQAFTRHASPAIGSNDNPGISGDVLLGAKNLAEVFNVQEGVKQGDESSSPSFRDLYNASQREVTDKEVQELRVFADTLRDGYTLCEFLNQLQSKQVTNPVSQNRRSLSLADTLDGCLDNLEQFLSNCITLGVPEEELFEARDLVIGNNFSLGRVATTIIAVSRRKTLKRRRSLTALGTDPESFVPALRQDSLHHRTRRFQQSLQSQLPRSLDDTKPTIITKIPPVSQTRSLQVTTNLLSIILRDKDMYRRFLELRGQSAQMGLDALQRIIDNGTLAREHKAMFVTALLRLSLKTSLYPSCLILEDIEREPFPCASGTFGDVYKGAFQGSTVCIKMVRVYKKAQIDHALRAFSREAVLWNQAKHKNVLPFYGVYQLDEAYRRVCLISPWMENGNVREYLTANPGADRLGLARDVLRGLRYLHERSIIHGDLKGPNILISPSGQAYLGDFGLSCMSDPNILQWTSMESSTQGGGTVRWKAPELIDPEKEHGLTKESDVYAFGCVCYEIFTGRVPFYEILHDYSVILSIMRGKTPSKPSGDSESFACWGLNEIIWNSIEECWAPDPQKRPTAKDVTLKLPRPLVPLGRKSNGIRSSRADFQAAMSGNRIPEVPGELIAMLKNISVHSS